MFKLAIDARDVLAACTTRYVTKAAGAPKFSTVANYKSRDRNFKIFSKNQSNKSASKQKRFSSATDDQNLYLLEQSVHTNEACSPFSR